MAIKSWNNEVRDKEVVTAVTRVSDTQVQVTLSPSANYDILTQEIINTIIPKDALVDTTTDVTAKNSLIIKASQGLQNIPVFGNMIAKPSYINVVANRIGPTRVLGSLNAAQAVLGSSTNLERKTTGSLIAAPSALLGTATVSISTNTLTVTGTLAASNAILSSTGEIETISTGSLIASPSVLSGLVMLSKTAAEIDDISLVVKLDGKSLSFSSDITTTNLGIDVCIDDNFDINLNSCSSMIQDISLLLSQ